MNSARREAGSARVVSSVTYITLRPCFTANPMASSVVFCRKSIVQPSAYWRIGLEPMKAQHSIGTPVRWTASAIGRMSEMRVRAAQFAVIFSRRSAIDRARRSTSAATCAPAPGRPMSAVSIPRTSIRSSRSSFSSIAGVRTDGDCKPSRSVSSSSITAGPRVASSVFQSWMSGWIRGIGSSIYNSKFTI